MFTKLKTITNKALNLQLSRIQFIIIISCYFAFILNIPFLIKITSIVTALETYNLIFLLSVPLFLSCLMVLFFTIFSVKLLLKPVTIIFTIVSALICYATFAYGVVFDYGMLQNTAETYSAEALSYVNLAAISFFTVFAILPALWIFHVSVKQQSLKKTFFARGKLITLSSLLIVVIVYAFYPNYAAVGRNNRILTSYLIPFKFLDSATKYVKKTYFSTPYEFEMIDDKPSLMVSADDKKNVFVLVVGETARAQSFHYNGYEKNTNEFTEQENIYSFTNMASCGTATAISVPCMFSRLKHENFDKEKAKNQQNVLDLIHLAGVDVLWIDNNDGCKGVCNRINTIKIDTNTNNLFCDNDYCFDEALLPPLTEKLHNLTAKNTLIVLHMIGSHGPTYFRRYPKKMAKFLPDCQRSDIQNCHHQELINTYDNTIIYSDFVLAQVINQLKQQNENITTSMLYLSDHGESLGESGAYLHGFPYAFAPEQQTHIPMLFWPGNNQLYQQNNCLQQLTNKRYSQDNLFDSLLGLIEVNSKRYDINNDIFSNCREQGKLAQVTKKFIGASTQEKAIQ